MDRLKPIRMIAIKLGCKFQQWHEHGINSVQESGVEPGSMLLFGKVEASLIRAEVPKRIMLAMLRLEVRRRS